MRRRIFILAAGFAAMFCGAPNATAGPKLNFPAEHIVFDIGDVLVSLNISEWKARMLPIAGKLDDPQFRSVVENFETGKLTKAAFVEGLRALRPENRGLSDRDITDAWNSQLGGVDCEAVRAVRALKEKGFKTYTLSTTNPLHVELIEEKMRSCFGKTDEDPLRLVFDKRYYTVTLGLLKPDPAIYKKMVADGNMDPAKTLFLDDSPANVIGAQQAGIYSLFIQEGADSKFPEWLPRLLGVN